MKKLEDIILEKGDFVEFTNGNTLVIDRHVGYTPSQLTNYGFGNVKQIKRPVKYETIYEAQQPILDKEEKEWLENMLRPLRKKGVKITIKKSGNDYLDGYLAEWEALVVIINPGSSLHFPPFKKGTMYKGMEPNKRYTLEELGLFKNEILNKKEKEYLENAVRPFKDKVQFIEKSSAGLLLIKKVSSEFFREYIAICIEDGPSTEYKGMQTNKDYTLEELGLFK